MKTEILKIRRWLVVRLMNFLARAVIRRYQPKIVAVTGSVGKTSTKEAVHLVLSHYFSARKSEKNLNTEVGLALTFLGGVEAKNNLFLWLRNLWLGLELILFQDKNYPRLIVVEMGADKPGDIEELIKIAKPNLAIVTAIGAVPVHVENYPRGKTQLLEEKAKIIESLSEKETAILNFDDPDVWKLREKTKARILSFGSAAGAEIRITDFEVRTKLTEAGFEVPDGIFFKLSYQDKVVPVRLKRPLGKPVAYALAAALATGVALIPEFKVEEFGQLVEEYRQEKGRMQLIEGIKNSVILDDSYNAAPAAMGRAIETLKELPGKRKIAVLGDMLEIGSYAPEVHQEIGKKALEFCDYLFFVGERMRFAYEAVLNEGFDKNKVFWFENSTQVAERLKPLIQPGDLILVKGSQGMRMERVIEEIMLEPEKAKELLVRQESPWK